MSTFNLDYPKTRIPLTKANKREKGGLLVVYLLTA